MHKSDPRCWPCPALAPTLKLGPAHLAFEPNLLMVVTGPSSHSCICICMTLHPRPLQQTSLEQYEGWHNVTCTKYNRWLLQ